MAVMGLLPPGMMTSAATRFRGTCDHLMKMVEGGEWSGKPYFSTRFIYEKLQLR
jgi:hypothetical protein